jgi:uncharacterized protein (TIGR00369 family)
VALDAPAIQALLDASPMSRFLGIQVVALRPAAGEADFVMDLRPELERAASSAQFHGGAIASFIDTAGDFAVAAAVGGAVPTMNLRVDYLRPATGTGLKATARVRKLGRTVAVVDIEVTDADQRLVAIGRGAYAASPG